MGKMGDTCRGVETSTKTGGTDQGVTGIIVPSTKLKGITKGRDSVGMLIWYESELINSIKLIKTG
jgi:hypothetical protein